MKEKLIQIGDVYKNNGGSIFVINKVSSTGLVLTAKNIETKQNLKFRYFNMTGKYISGVCTELGNVYNGFIPITLTVTNSGKVVLKREYR